MMTKKYVANKIKVGLAERLDAHGFKYVKSKEIIIREHNAGFDAIYLRIIDYNPVFQIEFSIGTRLSAIEDIVNRFIGEDLFNSKYKSTTITVAAGYDVLSDNQNPNIEISSENDLDNAQQDFFNLILNKGLSLFQQYKNLKLVNELKKTQILTDTSGLSYILRNLMQSLTLMKLCNDPDFNEFCIKYRELYIPWVGQEISGRKALDDLIVHLKKINF